MIRVFLADDEIAIREGIRNSKIWAEDGKEGYVLVGEAPDGEIALSMIRDEQPDILITDVRMPFMDGMQLAEMVTRQMPWIQVIILSGYDDFNYARKAMSLGVKDYLLKPISSQELKEALDRVSERMREERQKARIPRFSGENRFLKEKLIYTVLNEQTPETLERQTAEQLRSLGITIMAEVLLAEDISWMPESRLEEGQDCLYALAQASQGVIYVCSGRHGTLALVQGDNERDVEERAYTFARSATSELERRGLGPVLICVGEPVHRLGQLPTSMRDARHLRHVVNAKKPLESSRVLSGKDMDTTEAQMTRSDVRPLYERLQYASDGDAFSILREYAASIVSTDIHTTLVESYLQVEIMMTAERMLRECGADVRDVELFQRLMQSMSNPQSVLTETEAAILLNEVLRYRAAHTAGQGDATLARARAYLAQHFNDPNLMLRDVSEHVGMSESRFSTVFGQKMGMTFTEYLTVLRMNKAKEYLSATQMRSSQIAREVGYNDPHYFSYLFRKNTAMTPSEFRKQVQGERNPTV